MACVVRLSNAAVLSGGGAAAALVMAAAETLQTGLTCVPRLRLAQLEIRVITQDAVLCFSCSICM